MQQTGTLGKRKRRNLSKVNGLGTVNYDPSLDTYTGRDMFESNGDDAEQNLFTIRTTNDTILQFSAKDIIEYRREASGIQYSRVTRNPSFHTDYAEEDRNYSAGRVSTAFSKSSSQYNPQHHSKELLKDRAYLIDRTSMQRFKQLIWLGITAGSLPWKWNEKTHRVEKWGPKMEKIWWIQWFFVSTQTFLLTGFQLYSFLQLFPKLQTYREVFMASFNFLWYTYCLMVNINLYFYKENTREYINTLFAFNYEYVKKYLIHMDGYQDRGRVLINYTIPGNIFQVFISVLLFLTSCSQPWYLFSFIYPKPWYWLIPFAFQQYMVIGQVITSFLLISWIVLAHTSTVQFWIRETHKNNDSDFTSDELRTPKNAFECYRSLQVLNKCLNDCVSPLGIPFVKFAVTTATVFCGFVFIRSINHYFVDEFPAILSFPLGVTNTVTAGFVVVRMGAEVHDLGSSFVDSWSQTKQKDFRRILMSCPSLKLWARRFYFVTTSTTITLFKASFDVITDCIITFPK